MAAVNTLVIKKLNQGHFCVIRASNRGIRVTQQRVLILHHAQNQCLLLTGLLLLLRFLADLDQHLRVRYQVVVRNFPYLSFLFGSKYRRRCRLQGAN